VAFLERESCEQWRQEFRLGDDLELALAEHVRELEVLYKRSNGANTWVTISLRCYRSAVNRTFAYCLQRAGNRAYRRVDSASS
jgi:hypothetical protein